MNKQTDKIVKTYKLMASIPNLVGAQLLKNATIVNSVWTQRNVERETVSKFMRSHFLTPELICHSETSPIDISNEVLVSISHSGNCRALVRDIDDRDGHKQHLEIWSDGNLQNCTNLTSLELHGDVYADGEFGVLEWSPDDTKLLYVAEKKEPKTESFLKRKFVKQDGSKEPELIVKGEQYLFKQDWGEQLVNKKQPVLVEYDVSNDSFKIIEGIPENVCPAQPTWSPDGSYIVGVAFKIEPRKLGLVYCTNRPNAVFLLSFDKVYEEISAEGKAVKSPKFTPDGKTLIWLQRNANGPHHSCMELVKKNMPLNNSKIEIIVDVVETEITIAEGQTFHGLYNVAFPKRCWASNNRLLLTTYQKYSFNTYVINIVSGCIMELQYHLGSQVVLDVCRDIILVNRRNALVPDKLAIACLPCVGQENCMFEELTKPYKLEYADNYICNYMDLKHEPNDDVVNSFSAIYVGPKTGKKNSFPLVIWPHGGPHSAFSNNFTLELGLYNAIGLAVLLVNYRGSTGAGQASVEFLLGKIGKSDVCDCLLATEQALKQFPWLDSNRLILIGGSHGGFLVTHLSGQYPDMFKVVIARNPVTDVASMSIISDIPDWCSVECGSIYTQVGQPNVDMLSAMRKASPIQYAHKVKAPTLLQVGLKDLRVPPAQSIEYFHRLKANGKNVRMNVYDDNHSISAVHNEIDNLINIILWIQQHIQF